MSFAWTHVYVAGDDLFELAALNRFHHAFVQRGLAGRLRPSHQFDPITTGTDVQSRDFWLRMQFDPTLTGVGTGRWQGSGNNYVLYQDYTGASDFTYTDWAYIKANALGGNGYRRKFPREFANLSSTGYTYSLQFFDLVTSTTYTDGTAFVNGDVAQNVDPDVYLGGGLGGNSLRSGGTWVSSGATFPDKGKFVNGHIARNLADGITYTRTAGAWIATPTAQPDVIETYGLIQIGDYIGPWILNDIHDAVNMLRAFGIGLVDGPFGDWTADSATNDVFGQDTTGTSTSWATSQGIALGDFVHGSVQNLEPTALSTGQFNNPIYSANLFRRKAKLAVPDNGIVYGGLVLPGSGGAATIDFYSMGFDPGFPYTFDDNGDPLLNGQMKKFDTQAGSNTGATIKSVFFGSTAAPNWCAAPSDPAGTGAGYLLSGLAVWRYDVPGGFDEQ